MFDLPWCEKHPELWWQRLYWESLRRPQPWCMLSRRSWSIPWRSANSLLLLSIRITDMIWYDEQLLQMWLGVLTVSLFMKPQMAAATSQAKRMTKKKKNCRKDLKSTFSATVFIDECTTHKMPRHAYCGFLQAGHLTIVHDLVTICLILQWSVNYYWQLCWDIWPFNTLFIDPYSANVVVIFLHLTPHPQRNHPITNHRHLHGLTDSCIL